MPLLIEALDFSDESVRSRASQALGSLSSQGAIDALCVQAIKNPAGPAAKICLASGKRPRDHERLCLFLFVTRQLDEFFGTKSKPLAQCSETEIKLALDSWLRHRDWPRLFQACLELPLRHSFAVFPRFRQSRWEPEADDLRSAYRQILADTDGQAVPETRPKAESPLFEQWLAEGRSGELAKTNEAELLRRLASATPPEGVGIVAALAAGSKPSPAAVDAVSKSPHWPVRLAGYATGLLENLASDAMEDSNYWIGQLASASGVLSFWPGRATPADLDALKAAPAEAWTGRLGTARKVLRTIMGHRITTGTFEEMVVEAGEFAGEFVDAVEPEFETD